MNSTERGLPTTPEGVPDYANLLSLRGRGAIVFGVGAGMGRQIAHALLSAGARVACVDLDTEVAAKTAAEVGGVAFTADVTQASEVERVLRGASAAVGPLRIVTDIVGFARRGPLVEESEDNWQFHERINLRHGVHVIRFAGPLLAEAGGGSMVFIASVSGHRGAQLHAGYGAFKAGLRTLVRGAGVELGPLGVRVNSISPGAIWTPRIANSAGADARREWDALFPLGRVGLPRDVAAAVLFLASDMSTFINGEDIVVDGGRGQMHPYPMRQLVQPASATLKSTPIKS